MILRRVNVSPGAGVSLSKTGTNMNPPARNDAESSFATGSGVDDGGAGEGRGY